MLEIGIITGLGFTGLKADILDIVVTGLLTIGVAYIGGQGIVDSVTRYYEAR